MFKSQWVRDSPSHVSTSRFFLFTDTINVLCRIALLGLPVERLLRLGQRRRLRTPVQKRLSVDVPSRAAWPTPLSLKTSTGPLLSGHNSGAQSECVKIGVIGEPFAVNGKKVNCVRFRHLWLE